MSVFVDLSQKRTPVEHLQFSPRLSHVTPPADRVAKAAEILNSGKRVSIFCGIGCRDDRDKVLQLGKEKVSDTLSLQSLR